MDLFEEALRRWEEALTFRDRQTEDEESCAAVKTGAGDAIAEHSMEVSTTDRTADSAVSAGSSGTTLWRRIFPDQAFTSFISMF